jgi:cytochrome c-type biogenesis protein CcmF
MNPGQITVFVSFFATVAATALLLLEHGRKADVSPAGGPGRRSLSGLMYLFATLSGLASAAILFINILGHQFDYSYVVRYSSRDLPLFYLISSFWAGQEGTFLLWALMVGLMGLFFSRQTNDKPALAVISGYLSFLWLILIVKSPFEKIGFTQPDGAGLNPLLQDPWMVIHPPILFLGYAAATFPFALVVSGLVRRNYSNWFRFGFGWTLFAALALGAGIIIGGFWAYEVLGWGGYWGWDPVENSSLVPWLVLLALVHGLIVQKAKGSLVRTNMLLAILAFLLVTYATFLTRSGILADFSVHSFTDLGINAYLVAIMVASAVTGLGAFIIRFRGIQSPKVDSSSVNREMTLLLSLYVIGAGALFTFAGMSSPILTGLIGKASQVDTPFYNKVNLPVAIAMSLLLGITPFLGWKEERFLPIMKRLSLPLILTALAAVISIVAGVTSALQIAFVATASFALVSNAIVTGRQYRSGWRTIGGPLSHVGVALLLIGIIGSGSFDESKKLVLVKGTPQNAWGYQVTFTGVQNSETVKQTVTLDVSDGRTTYTARPKLYFSEYNKAMMREPDIRIFPLKDLYISPLELRSSIGSPSNPVYELGVGVPTAVGPYSVTFVRFETGQHMAMSGMTVGAVLAVTAAGRTDTVVPLLTFSMQGEPQAIPVQLTGLQSPGSSPQSIAMTAMSVEQKKIRVQLAGEEELVVDVSTKPLMMVVWTGVVLIIAGTFVAWRRRTAPAEAPEN